MDKEWFCWEGELSEDRPGIYNIAPDWIERNPPVERLLPLIAPDGLIEIKRVKCFDQPVEIDVIG